MDNKGKLVNMVAVFLCTYNNIKAMLHAGTGWQKNHLINVTEKVPALKFKTCKR